MTSELENDAGYMETIKRLKKENTMLIKENKEALEVVEKLMNDNTELEATIEKWKSGENISRGAIGLFVHDYNEYCIEENRRDYMVRDEDVEGFFDSLDPLEDDNQ